MARISGGLLGQLVKSSLRRIGYQISEYFPPKTTRTLNPDITDREWEIYEKVAPFTMLSMERILANIRAVEHVAKYGIPGDIVECGVWRGGSSMAMAMALNEPRTIWMYDTYQGMTPPTASDVNFRGRAAADLLRTAKANPDPEKQWIVAHATLEDVRANMASSGYALSRINFIVGPVEETIPATVPDKIAVLRIDTDWYESTKHELIHLYPLIVPGGVLIIDDYGHWEGARKAVDEYFTGCQVFMSRIDYSGRLIVKSC